MNHQELKKEAYIFGKYLIGESISNELQDRYADALASRVDTRNDEAVVYATKHPWSIGLLDAGLAITNPFCELRKRLYLLLAILEASPDYVDYFLPKKRSPFFILLIGLSGLRAILKTLLGFVLVKLVAQ